MGANVCHQEEKLENAEREPWIVFLVGNRGAGKSRLAKQIVENSKETVVLINADEIHSAVLGIEEAVQQVSDNKKIVFSKDIQAEGTRRVNKLLLDSIEQRKNIVLDASFGKNHFKFMQQLQNIGYKVEVQGVVINKYQAAYNVERRTINFFDECEHIKNGKKGIPEVFNAMDVGYQVPLANDDKIVDIIEEVEKRGIKLSLFEFGKNEAGYISDSLDKGSDDGVDFYYEHQDINYALLHSNLIKISKRAEKYERDLFPLVSEVKTLAEEQNKFAVRVRDKNSGR